MMEVKKGAFGSFFCFKTISKYGAIKGGCKRIKLAAK